MNQDRNELITSVKNPLIQLTRLLLSDRSARVKNNLFIAEGTRLAEEVLKASQVPQFILYSNRLSKEGRSLMERWSAIGVRTAELPADLLDRISETETSQGILLALPITTLPLPPNPDLVLILDQLRDPGNLGTILRSAVAAGAQLVYMTPGSVDAYMPKVVRAGMGAHFRLSIRSAPWDEILDYCHKQVAPPLKIWLSESEDGTSLWEADLRSPIALVIGGEAEGAGITARKSADDLIHIPMPGDFESLNAGTAASILLFEVLRQRQQ